MSTSIDRVVEWAGAHNVRDLGGLPVAAGGHVASGRMFRSDYPGLAVERDPGTLQRLGVRTVVDLRRRPELDLECTDWADHGVEHVHAALSAGRTSSWHASYERYLEHRPGAVVDAVRHVIDVDRHPVLFHCAAGKDRTGVVAALVLDLLGVDDDTIVADHLASAGSVEAVLTRLRAAALYGEMLAASTVEQQLPQEQHVRGLLRWVRAHGGSEAWLQAHGLEGAAVGRFRATLLDRSHPLS